MAVIETMYRPERPANSAARSGGECISDGKVQALWGYRGGSAPGP